MADSELDPEKLYSALRDYLKHEDSLINWRITWNLGLQLAFFGAFGLLLKKPPTNEDVFPHDVLESAPYAIAVVAQVVGLSSWFGVIAAQRSLNTLTVRWQRVRLTIQDRVWSEYYPALSAGDDPFARRYGNWAALGPIMALQIAWILIVSFKAPYWGWLSALPSAYFFYVERRMGKPTVDRLPEVPVKRSVEPRLTGAPEIVGSGDT